MGRPREGSATKAGAGVRNVIANGWIDAKHARFDVSTLPDTAVSRDLFSERVLVERQAFMEAQAQALDAQRQAMAEEGWKEAVVARREEIQHRLLSMDEPQREFDEETSRKLAKIAAKQEKLEAKAKDIGEEDAEALDALQEKFDALEAEEQEIVQNSPQHFSEETKATATVFLLLDPDGQVYPVYRVPRTRRHASAHRDGHQEEAGVATKPTPPTSDDLSDKQLAVTFTHQALGVREALLKHDSARRRVLALILHEKVRSEALSVSHEANGTTLHASQGDGFSSSAFDQLNEKRTKLDPFARKHHVEDREGYEQLGKMSHAKLDALIDLLVIDCITAHMQRRTELVQHLADELKVNIRSYWRPDAVWLASYQKIQLACLMAKLRGPAYSPAHETRKKSELVEALAKLFADAAEGKLDDKELAERANRWLPSNLREAGERPQTVAA